MSEQSTVSFRCNCGQRMKARIEHRGRNVACPKCHEVVKIPSAPESSVRKTTQISVKAPAASPHPQPPRDDLLLSPVCGGPVSTSDANPTAQPHALPPSGTPVLNHGVTATPPPGYGTAGTLNSGLLDYDTTAIPTAHQSLPANPSGYGPGGYHANLMQASSGPASMPLYRPADEQVGDWLPRVLCLVGGGMLCLMGAAILLIVILVLMNGAEVRARSLRGLIIPFIMISSGIGLIVKGVHWGSE